MTVEKTVDTVRSDLLEALRPQSAASRAYSITIDEAGFLVGLSPLCMSQEPFPSCKLRIIRAPT